MRRPKIFPIVLSGLGVFGAIVGLAYFFRTPVLLVLASLVGAPPLAEKESVVLGPNEYWADDYYTVEALDAHTYAISEPRYFRDVYAYLLVGSTRALLIDSGSPLHDISPVVASLTDRPISVIATHLHFDHVGNLDKFDHILMPDLPGLKERVHDGHFVPEPNEYLGHIEGFETRGWDVAGWWVPGEDVDLGGRTLRLLSTPGHTPDSISIWEPGAERLFIGDYAGDGEVYAFMPNSSLRALLATTTNLLMKLPPATALYAAHGASDFPQAPVTKMGSLTALQKSLMALRDGQLDGHGFWPRRYPVDAQTVILTDMPGPGSRSWDFD